MGPRRWFIPGALLATGMVAAGIARHRAVPLDLRGSVVVITGGSRGLGLAMARELAREGCRLSICARDGGELERARADLEALGATVMVTLCDVSDRHQVKQLIDQTTQRFGTIDILINNAGVIMVGPLQHQTIEDFEHALSVMFWGSVYATLQVLPAMRARRSGQIVNITSIGGKVSVPRLVPYSVSKFAAVGFSEGIRAELADDGVSVLTVVPGLMRTGSHVNALFKGQHRKEYLWFSLGATLPFTSMDAEAAARRIVRGIKMRESEVILTWQANLLARIHGLAPGFTADALGLGNRFLPAPGGIGANSARGSESQTPFTESAIEQMGHAAADHLNQRGPAGDIR